MKLLCLDNQAVNTLRAALRAYEKAGYGEPAARPDDIHALASDKDRDISMDRDGVRELFRRVSSSGVGAGATQFVIYSDSEDGFWSNEDGWVGAIESASRFRGRSGRLPLSKAGNAAFLPVAGGAR